MAFIWVLEEATPGLEEKHKHLKGTEEELVMRALSGKHSKKGRAETHGWVLAATDGKFSQQLCFLRQAFEWETWYHPRGTALGC